MKISRSPAKESTKNVSLKCNIYTFIFSYDWELNWNFECIWRNGAIDMKFWIPFFHFIFFSCLYLHSWHFGLQLCSTVLFSLHALSQLYMAVCYLFWTHSSVVPQPSFKNKILFSLRIMKNVKYVLLWRKRQVFRSNHQNLNGLDEFFARLDALVTASAT